MPASKFKIRTLSKIPSSAKAELPTDLSPGVASGRLGELAAELRQLEVRLRAGGGLEKIERQHKQGKLTARERIDLLLDKDSVQQEIGLLVAYDQYDGGAPAAEWSRLLAALRAGSRRRRQRCHREGRLVVAGDNQKILRAQEIAMRRESRLFIWSIRPE